MNLPPARARVVFDEAHSEAWTIDPQTAARMQPAHPADASYAAAAAALGRRDFAVAANRDRALDGGVLEAADVLVLAHPADRRYERTVSDRSPRLSAEEIDAVEGWVRAGGGLLVLGETEQNKYDTNVGDLLARFGLGVEHDTVQDYAHHAGAPSWVRGRVQEGARGAGGDVLARVADVAFYRAGTVRAPEDAQVLVRASPAATAPDAPLAAVATAGAGRVAVLADSDLFGDDGLHELDHLALLENLAYWLAGPAFRAGAGDAPSPALEDPAWPRLREATDELRRLQAPDGALAEDADFGRAAELVDEMVEAIEALAPRFGHQADHLAATVVDLRRWAAGAFGVPDFTAALDAFRPERHRRDRIEHLVVFPMYKQNGSRDRVFEALLVRVPWPDWLAELERTRYGNPKFVPVTLVDHTEGYDSECAVLFPETVTVAGAPANHFGAIFCDREAERFRRVGGAAADLLAINVPPDAAALLASPALSRDAFVLWDLVHDRAHSRGDLPFDPFMIRQRAPYWMYALEELRCDLTAFGEAVALEREGLAFARHVQYAVLFDRLLRFPITGTRVRNYDGLGGQLLFAFLHQRGVVRWTHNRLTVAWDEVPDGVAALRHRIEDLYRAGIDRSKLQHWCAAHDLVAASVPPAAGSPWAAERRAFTDVEDPRALIDLAAADEFPLSMFYASLRQKLAPTLERPPSRRAELIA